MTEGRKSYEALSVESLKLSACFPKLKRGFAVLVELEKAASLVDVGRKERLAACWEATLASEVTLNTQTPSASVFWSPLSGCRSHLCFDKSSGRGPSGTLCWSRMDCLLPLKLGLLSAGGGRGADVTVGLLACRSLLSPLLVVLWNLRRTRPSDMCVSGSVLCALCSMLYDFHIAFSA